MRLHRYALMDDDRTRPVTVDQGRYKLGACELKHAIINRHGPRPTTAYRHGRDTPSVQPPAPKIRLVTPESLERPRRPEYGNRLARARGMQKTRDDPMDAQMARADQGLQLLKQGMTEGTIGIDENVEIARTVSLHDTMGLMTDRAPHGMRALPRETQGRLSLRPGD